ncbi:MAG: hypothetical protein E7463_01205 [Ruminococcaceae bacterium]|nr:hypothetical protein [Oscillospiraceae bacterium]
MTFYDAHLTYGLSSDVNLTPPMPCPTIEELDAALIRAGVSGGLVFGEAPDNAGVVIGNRMLAEDLKKAKTDLYGLYTIVPRFTHEIPSAADLPAVLKRDKMAGLRMSPATNRWLPKPGIIADYLEMACELRIPVFFDTKRGITLGEIYDILERFPALTCILSYKNIWPADRYYRPFIAQFPNLHMELSSMITDQGIDKLVDEYGAERFLFGSGFPWMYIGGQQMQLRHACISEDDKNLIASGNLLRLIKEARI